MAILDLETVDQLLTTTRSVRKRLDLTRPVEPGVIERCIEIAFQAPTGSNAQGWHFVVVTDPEKRERLAALYRRGADLLVQSYADGPFPAGDLRERQLPRMLASGFHLYEHLHDVPVLVIPCIEGRFETAGVVMQATLYGSILPAVWSFMLALRARGIGACWTTDHLFYEAEAAQVLDIPDHVTQAALLPVAYFTGADFKPAKRLPARERTHWNCWGLVGTGDHRAAGVERDDHSPGG
jgi:nitroreductase